MYYVKILNIMNDITICDNVVIKREDRIYMKHIMNENLQI